MAERLHAVLALAGTLGVVAGCGARPTVVRAPNAPELAAAPAVSTAPKPVPKSVGSYAETYVRRTTDPESSMPTVGGWVRVHAPLAAAYEVALRFGEIKELDPDIEQSTVVDKHTVKSDGYEATDVYLRIPTYLHEYVWGIVRFRPVVQTGEPAVVGYAYRGDEVEGNLDDLRISWRLVPDGPGETLAQIELLADPKLPLPHAWLIPQLEAGVRVMLNRFRAKTERGGTPEMGTADEGL